MPNGRPTHTVWISPVRSDSRPEKSSFMNSSFGRSPSRNAVAGAASNASMPHPPSRGGAVQ